MQKREVVVVSGVRTAVGTFGGSLKGQNLGDLAGKVVAEAVSRANVKPESVGHCVIGNVIHTEPRDMYIGRVASVEGGLPIETPALTVNRLCGSGLQAVVTAAQQIQLGLCDTVVAGGAEAMTNAPYHIPSARFGARLNNAELVDPMVGALQCPFNYYHMGVTAENVAEKFTVTREEQDIHAAESHKRAQNAIEQGYFKDQIMPVELKTRRGVTVFDTDEHVRFDCKVEDMAKLKPVFKKEQGTVTAGNASGLNDGAAAVVMMDAEAAKANGHDVMATLVDYSVVGVDPKIMGIGPVPAIKALLENNNLSVDDIDLFEVNEAFAAQALAVANELNLPKDRLNPNGSGISIGHPVGATGAIITVKALHELARIDGTYAVVSLCIGGGQGIAALFKRG